jgi:hypothetical protein
MKIVKSSCSSKQKVRTCTFSPQVNIKNKRTAVQTEQDVNAAHSEAKLQDLINDIKSNIYTKVKAVATSPEFGFDENEVDDYFFVETSATEIGEDHHEAIRVEVRGEVSYEGLEDLMEALNPIIESYDSYAYFEPVEPGIIEAYVSVDQVDMSIYGATVSPDHMFYDYHGKRFSVHDNSSEIGEDSIDDVYFLWKGNISQQAGAYNDADEDYVYAFIRGRGVIEYYKKGKYVATDNYTLRDEDDFEYAWEYMEIILQHICDRLIAYNKDVPDHMVYNSTDIEDSSDDSIMFEGNNYEYVTNNDGYWIYRAVIDGKGVWRAMPQGSDESGFSRLSFPISYDQARGFEPINEPSDITKLRKDLGKKLLPKSGQSVEATEDLSSYPEEFRNAYQKAKTEFINRYPNLGVSIIRDDPYAEDGEVAVLVKDYDTGDHAKCYLVYSVDELISSDYEWMLQAFEETAEAIGLLEDNTVYSSVESSDYESDSGIFIEDIIDSLENNGYDLSRIRSIKQGLLKLFGYKGKDADIIIHDLVAGRFIDPNDWVDKDYTPGIYSATEEDEEDLPMVDQEYDSAATSINSNKLPAIYKMVNFNEGDVVVDFGGGKFDNAVEYIRDKGATLVVYDPYNRSAEHNKEVLRILRENGGADAAVNSNVLNVIKEPEARKNVLENIARITKPGAPIYITVYEGKGDGQEGPTKSGYQLNRKTADYLEEIQEVFPDATRRGKLITAHNSGSITSSEDITAEYNIQFKRSVIDELTPLLVEKLESNYGIEFFVTDMFIEGDNMHIQVYGDDKYHGDIDIPVDYSFDIWDLLEDAFNKFQELFDGKSSSPVKSYTDVEEDISRYDKDIVSYRKIISKSVEDSDDFLTDYTMYEVVTEDGSVEYECYFGDNDIYGPWNGEGLDFSSENYDEAVEWYNSYESDEVKSSESIEADAFSSLEDQYLSPPEYDDPIEHEDSQELIEVELDQVITVDVDGDYEWDDDTYVWASPDESNEEWRSEDGVYIDDKVGVVEHIDDLIIPNVPTRPGKYRVTGLAKLIYDVSGIQEYRTNYGPDDYESDLDTDHAAVSFNFSKSSVENLKITPVRR